MGIDDNITNEIMLTRQLHNIGKIPFPPDPLTLETQSEDSRETIRRLHDREHDVSTTTYFARIIYDEQRKEWMRN